jgi:predicted nucleic acid-binding Zn ribbon protein
VPTYEYKCPRTGRVFQYARRAEDRNKPLWCNCTECQKHDEFVSMIRVPSVPAPHVDTLRPGRGRG